MPDALTHDLLTQIQGGQMTFAPRDASHESIVEFQATAKRIEWAKDRGYIKDAKFLRDNSGGLHVIVINIVGGLTLDGEEFLLGDPDERTF